MKIRWSVALVLVVTGLLFVSPAFAASDCPGGMAPTVDSLIDCVHHAVDVGYIDNQGVATSLLAEARAAKPALGRGQTQAAIGQPQAFVLEVTAQSGRHIAPDHAEHMIMHAQMVITALGG